MPPASSNSHKKWRTQPVTSEKVTELKQKLNEIFMH